MSEPTTTAYTVRRFPSATGYVYFQVMNPFGERVFESRDLAAAQAEAKRLNEKVSR